MTKQECVNLIKLLKYCYPAFFKTRTKEQFVNFANAFISEFEEFDYKLADHAINKLISKRYKEKNKYCPNIIEMKQSVIECMMSVSLEVIDKIRKEGYFKVGISETGDEAEKREADRYIRVLDSLVDGHLLDIIRKEIEYRMDNIEEYKKYKGILLLKYL